MKVTGFAFFVSVSIISVISLMVSGCPGDSGGGGGGGDGGSSVVCTDADSDGFFLEGDKIKAYSQKMQKDMASFASTWMRNIKAQQGL